LSDESANVSYLEVVVKPKAHRDEIAGWLGDSLKVAVSAPPEGGRANEAVCSLISRALDVSKSSVTVVRGKSSRKKLLRLEGVPPERVANPGRKPG
jgi:hypothetical protein